MGARDYWALLACPCRAHRARRPVKLPRFLSSEFKMPEGVLPQRLFLRCVLVLQSPPLPPSISPFFLRASLAALRAGCGRMAH